MDVRIRTDSRKPGQLFIQELKKCISSFENVFFSVFVVDMKLKTGLLKWPNLYCNVSLCSVERSENDLVEKLFRCDGLNEKIWW